MADVSPGLGILAGRDRELGTLRRWLAEALAGHGRLVVLTGPPGIGKTRLAEELVTVRGGPGSGCCGAGPSRSGVRRRCGYGGGYWTPSAAPANETGWRRIPAGPWLMT
jgi:hypothetical protein